MLSCFVKNQYVIRGVERKILKNPNAILIGYPGVGKTTMARYIAIKLIQSGKPVILITTKVESGEESISYDFIEMKDENGKSIPIPTIFVSQTYERVEELGDAIIDALEIIKKIERKLKSYNPEELKEYLKKKEYVDEKVLKELSQAFGMGASLYLPLLAIAESLELIGRILKFLKRKKNEKRLKTIGKSGAVIIIDDARDLKIPPSVLEKLKSYGVNVILTARADFKELLNVGEHNVLEWAKEQLKLGDIVLRSLQVKFIPPTNFKTFERILKANDIKFEKVHELYIASGGLPAVAIMLYQFYKDNLNNLLNEIKDKIGGWFGIEWGDKESAKKSLRYVYGSIEELYWRLVKESIAFLALVAQPDGVAEDELRTLCEKKGERYNKAIASIKSHRETIIIEEESWVTGNQKVYRFNELWIHLPILIRAISEYDEDILESLAETQKLLLEIIDEKKKKSGKATGRMVLSALRHIKELNSYPKDKISLNQKRFVELALYWGAIALNVYPRIGLDMHSLIMDIFSKSEKDESQSLLAAKYLFELSESSRSYERQFLLKDADQFLIDSNREDVLAMQVAACASVARSFSRFKYDKEGSKKYLEKAKELLGRIQGKAKKIAKVEFNSEYAAILEWENNLEKAEKICRDTLNNLEELKQSIDEYLKDESVRRYFSIINGDPKREMERWIKENILFTLHFYGWACLKQDKLDDALEKFNKAYEIAKEIGDIKEELINKGLCIRISIIKYGHERLKCDFKNIKDLLDNANMNYDRITLEIHDHSLARYILANLIVNNTYPKDFNDKEISFGCVRGLLLGMIYIIEQIKRLNHRYKKGEVLKALHDCIDKSGGSYSCFAKILIKIIKNDIDNAKDIAKEYAKKSDPILSRLFGELAESLKENKIDENALNYLIKVFYLHI